MTEDESSNYPWNILFAGEPYWVELPRTVAEFVKFEDRFNALVWLHRKVADTVSTELRRLEASRKSGKLRTIAEPDLIFEETAGTLEDTAEISSGAIIAACSSAVESLFTDLLPESSSGRRAPRGLVAKAQFLMTTWPNAHETADFMEHIRWLSQRRNSFAHRLIDEGGAWDATGTAYSFDRETVEETFERVGKIVAILERGYDAYRSRVGFLT
jgi:hypothetical protein